MAQQLLLELGNHYLLIIIHRAATGTTSGLVNSSSLADAGAVSSSTSGIQGIAGSGSGYGVAQAAGA